MRTLIAGLALAGSAALAHAQATTTEGEVRKVDTAQRKITLKHGEIKNLDMPPMSSTGVMIGSTASNLKRQSARKSSTRPLS